MNTRKSTPASDSLPLETLEGRQLLSATLSGTALTVSGSAVNDTIQLSSDRISFINPRKVLTTIEHSSTNSTR